MFVSFLRMIALVASVQLFAMAVFGQKGKDSLTITEAGRFRVTLTGFMVNRQTNDNIFESDGKGDEVYILAEVAQYDNYSDGGPGLDPRHPSPDWLSLCRFLTPRGNLTVRRSLSSVVMGDINNQRDPPRIQAGHAGREGGLRTGDRFPTDEPWNLAGSPAADRPPMLVWDGELRRGRDMVVIIPTIWEWDAGNPQLRSQFTQEINSYLAGDPSGWRCLDPIRFTGGDVFGAGDRPVSLRDGDNAWTPQGLALNFDRALWASTNSPSHTGTGVVEIRYFAADAGDYSLYVKIERIDNH